VNPQGASSPIAGASSAAIASPTSGGGAPISSATAVGGGSPADAQAAPAPEPGSELSEAELAAWMAQPRRSEPRP